MPDSNQTEHPETFTIGWDAAGYLVSVPDIGAGATGPVEVVRLADHRAEVERLREAGNQLAAAAGDAARILSPADPRGSRADALRHLAGAQREWREARGG